MLKIDRLYSEPPVFKPISFGSGLNLILGERDESSSKNNGVGKSICIEFLNFALLKKRSESRVARIPGTVLDPSVSICVDFTVAGRKYTLKRSLYESETPELVSPDGVIKFAKLDDATAHMGTILFADAPEQHPTFREILAPLLRDERSEFKSIVGSFDTSLSLPENYRPHLYFFGIDFSAYDEIKKINAKSTEITKARKNVQEGMNLSERKLSDVRSDINALEGDVRRIGKEIEDLESKAGFEIVRDEMLELEHRIEELRRRRAIVSATIRKMQPITERIELDEEDIRDFYDNLKQGLGEFVSRELSQVIEFKEKIERFQRHVLEDRAQTLRKERDELGKELDVMDRRYKELLSVLDQQGNLKNLRQSYAAFKLKRDELGTLQSLVERYDVLTRQLQDLKRDREKKLSELQQAILDQADVIRSFEATILDMHDYVQGNLRASFNIEVTPKKPIINIDMRIAEDGSHSIDREKVFIYDFGLLTNGETSERHPGLLVHDGIFEVDQDTLRKNLRHIEGELRNDASRQYILTLNSDRLDGETELAERLSSFVRARFTKAERFLQASYQEKR
ncbi:MULTISPECIES: DUF2326 domain-containing protein [Agrobacterium]|uniref:DUF2326 domain-containing protein n=1 Tax=Agrobacterium TaxID=357 RepID=UPI00278A13FB|nr:DUF2326 domain-containing protein [Agrobacterium sp. SORGH_AS_0745]MDP9762118.1 uncharacterized protein YydD (DUF2326 family) [Agrobacterium tumefaciens]MDQ1220592.1 uncharacterized protein YydD (DUF2326 family) [Agrobacterium sp. SORGH_AS_0745]